jgi:hypothetical protein
MHAMAASPTFLRPYRGSRTADRIFFSVMPLLMLATVLFGFAKTYFLAGMVAAPLPNRLIHLHGAAFTLWMVLLIVQTGLISAHRVKWHRRLGLFGFGLAVVMVVLGCSAAVNALHRGSGVPDLDPVTFLIVPFTSMLLFSVFVLFAYRQRRNVEAHKRLITIATISLMDAAVARWPLAVVQQYPVLQDVVIFGFLFLIVVYDIFSLHRVSKTTMWASVLLVVIHLGRVPVGLTHGWHALVGRLL